MTIRGKIEAIRDGILFGWLWDELATDAHVSFRLTINGEQVGRFVADLPRADLRERKIGNGDHAFKIALPPTYLGPGDYEARVEVDGIDVIRVSPLIYVKPPLDATNVSDSAERPVGNVKQLGSTTIRGRIEQISKGHLLGWLWDSVSDQALRFALFVNEREVGVFDANVRRMDLVKAGIGNGEHAFRVRILTDWLGAGDNTLTIRTLPEGKRLPDALVVRDADLSRAHPEQVIIERDVLPNEGRRQSAEVAVDPVRGAISSGEPSELTDAIASSTTVPIGAPPELLPRDIAVQMREWTTTRLVSFHATLEKDVLLERAKKLLREKEWAELGLMAETASPSRRGRIDLDILIGRALLNDGKFEKASNLLGPLAKLAPANPDANFYASTAHSRNGDYERAVEFGRVALELKPESVQYLIDHATNCRRYAARIDSDVNLKRSILTESTKSYRQAIKLGTSRIDFCLLNSARNEMELDQFEFALATSKELVELEPDNVDGLILVSQALVSLNRIKEALSVAERIVELDPLRQGPRFQLRSLQALVQDEDRPAPTFGIARWSRKTATLSIEQVVAKEGGYRLEPEATLELSANPAMGLASINLTWLLFADEEGGIATVDADGFDRIQRSAMSWSGRLVGTFNGAPIEVWRRELLINLAESNVFENLGSMRAAISTIVEMVATVDFDSSTVPKRQESLRLAKLEPGPVIAMSRHGVVKFGGGEQFLESMAEHYEGMGFDPIVVGTRPEKIGEEGVQNGRRYAFVDMAPSSLRAFFLRIRPRFVHVLSGLGFQTAEALDYLDIPFVYGVHFWRDCLGLAQDDTRFFIAHDKGPIAKPQFRYVIEKAATVYSNSEYTREVLEESFSVRTPVIYSLPREVQDLMPGSEEEVNDVIGRERDFVLLVNAKNDKGFDLMVETAKRVPHVTFVAIASQSDRREAQIAIEAAGTANIKIIPHTNRMDIVYSRARVVAVPSYKFVETFSRVCIEAQRFSKPVIGSHIGNVPYLLRRSGIILNEDPDAWAQVIARIFADESFYSELVGAAKSNSQTYSYDRQRRAVSDMIATAPSNILIGIGSGIGNMLHVSPMIRNIAKRIGRKVDLVMTEDHSNSLFLLQNDDFVNSVYAVRQETLRRRYDAIFITHSFGNARLAFQNQNVIYSRDWQNFEPGGPLHETAYNLEAAKQLLGIPYDTQDITGYYVGNYNYEFRLDGLRVGIHGGSKDGFWRSKRWPGHQALAERLRELGAEVSSFGIEEEFVPGTLNATGGTISEMVEHMLGLNYFISNDSGVMNIANALGIPVMGLFAPTNPETRGPIGIRSSWIALNKHCAPCEVTKSGRETFMSGNCRCIEELTFDQVFGRVVSHMKQVGLTIEG
jgi:ADP-heptose:LPS heptosyltransferase/glycosyltransferase involved in cell wall biosynthesis/tetratricopeptide (TPR) repeat protein